MARPRDSEDQMLPIINAIFFEDAFLTLEANFIGDDEEPPLKNFLIFNKFFNLAHIGFYA